jgi:hypothetical protein
MFKAEQARLEAMNEADQGPRSISQIRRDNQAKGGSSVNGVSGLDESAYAATSLNALCPPDPNLATINVICKWKGLNCNSNEIITGQHNLLSLHVRPQVRDMSCPLTVTAKHKHRVAHDFESGPAVRSC